jgi:hypothetical protein
MDRPPLDIETIAQGLNARAHEHAIGALQTIRTELKGFVRRPGTAVFSSQTIHESWAFFTQTEAAKLLGTTQAQVSALMRCRPVSAG